MDAGTRGNALGITGGVSLVTTRFSVVSGTDFDVDSRAICDQRVVLVVFRKSVRKVSKADKTVNLSEPS